MLTSTSQSTLHRYAYLTPTPNIAIAVADSYIFINHNDILYISKEDEGSRVFIDGHPSVYCNSPVSTFQNSLRQYTNLIHCNACIINVNKIERISKTKLPEIVLKGGEEIQIDASFLNDIITNFLYL